MGNTPTCVGKTLPISTCPCWIWKHPHVRGEDHFPGVLCGTHEETPPRAWGRLLKTFAFMAGFGNTPTCVGKTYPQKCINAEQRKHPHVRGEDLSPAMPGATERETPPRAWGRLHAKAPTACLTGNTPTCVGKTASCATVRRQSRKHPHVRGEDTGS